MMNHLCSRDFICEISMKYSSFCKSDVRRYLNYSRNEIKINLKTLKIDETYIYIYKIILK